jgi:predicted methyltransferase
VKLWFLLAFALPLLQSPVHLEDYRDDATRDAWQRPGAVMDALGIRRGSRVADIGAGSGYFTFHLARRVGTMGRVYAVDVQRPALEAIARRAAAGALPQVRIVEGTDEDPRLPAASVDAILVVNTYHELRAFDAMMQGFRRALKPGGTLAIIDCEALAGELPGRAYRYHRISSAAVREDAERAGFRLARRELGFVDPNASLFSAYWYFLVFERPGARQTDIAP